MINLKRLGTSASIAEAGSSVPGAMLGFFFDDTRHLSRFEWEVAGAIILSDRELRRLGRITRHSGRAVADFVFMDGVGPTFMNMAVMGLLAIGWLWLVGGDLNGPTLGGVITCCSAPGHGTTFQVRMPMERPNDR